MAAGKAALLVLLANLAGIGLGQERTVDRVGTGMQLLEWCQRDADLSVHSSATEGYQKGYCEGLVRAAAEVARVEKEASVPDQVSLGQEIAVVTLYLQQHPERLHEPDILLAHRAIVEAFPYQGKRKGNSK